MRIGVVYALLIYVVIDAIFVNVYFFYIANLD